MGAVASGGLLILHRGPVRALGIGAARLERTVASGLLDGLLTRAAEHAGSAA